MPKAKRGVVRRRRGGSFPVLRVDIPEAAPSGVMAPPGDVVLDVPVLAPDNSGGPRCGIRNQSWAKPYLNNGLVSNCKCTKAKDRHHFLQAFPRVKSLQLQGINNGDYSVIYVGPETLMTTEVWKDILLHNPVYQTLCVIAVDEAHLLHIWYMGEEFRPAFKALGELRSHFPATPFLLLSATMDQELFESVLRHINIMPNDITVVSSGPDRPNIYLEWRLNTKMSLEHITPYLDILKEKNTACPKGVLFVRNFQQLGKSITKVMSYLKEYAYCTPDRSVDERIVDTFHGSMFVDDQQRVLSEFMKTRLKN